jgi:hypothetical protein
MKRKNQAYFSLASVLMGLAAVTAAGAQSSRVTGSKLVSAVVDPEKKMSYTRSGNTEDQTMSVSKNQFTYSLTFKDNGRQICRYDFTGTFDAPPENLKQGQEFTLNVQLTCTATGDTKERPWVQSARFDCGGVAGPELVKGDRVWVGQHSEGGPFVPSAQAAFVFRMPTDGYKFYINAVATGCGTVTEYKYDFVGASTGGGAAPDDQPATPPPADRPSDQPPPARKDPCGTERDALVVASLKARLAFSGVQSLRSAIEQLNQEWENRRQAAFWSGTLDVALMAGSVLTKPLASAFGREIAKQSISAALLEAGLKGMVKQGLKQYINYCSDQNLGAPGEVLTEVATKGGKDLVKKGFEKFTEKMLTDMLLEKTLAGEMGGLESVLAGSVSRFPGGVDGTMMGGTALPPAREFIRREFAGPTAALLGVMISLQSAMDGAWTAHRKLESLRLAVSVLRDNEIVADERWRQAMEDLDRTRSSFNYCRQLHPESPPDEQAAAAADFSPEPEAVPPLQPMRRVAEAETRARTLAAGNGQAVVLPYRSASLAVRDGNVVVSIITPDDIYYAKQGLVAGSLLISINFEPFTVQTLEELRKLLSPADQEMLVLEFLRPDGKRINLPIPVEKNEF